MNIKESMGFLGICRKAGKLSCGHDSVIETIVTSKSNLVILSSDASERLENEIRHACSYDGKDIPVIRCACSMQDFAAGIGRKSAVYSVTDKGFSDKLRQLFGEE